MFPSHRFMLQIALIGAMLVGGLITAALAQTRPDPRPCPCLPNVKEFGYFHRTWRPWPGERRPEEVNPRFGAEVLPTPQAEEILPLPPATPPRAPSAVPEEPTMMPRTSILPPETTPVPVPPSRVAPPPSTPTPTPTIKPKGDATPGLPLPGLPGLPGEEESPPATPPRNQSSGSRESAPAASPPTSPREPLPLREAPKTKNSRPQESIQLTDRESAPSGMEAESGPQLATQKIDSRPRPEARSQVIGGEQHRQATPVADTSHPRPPRVAEKETQPGHSTASDVRSDSTATITTTVPQQEAAAKMPKPQSRTQVVSMIEDLEPERNASLSKSSGVDPLPVAVSSSLLRKIETSAVVDKNLLAEPANEPVKSASVDRIAAVPGSDAAPVRRASDEEELVIPPIGLGGYCPVELVLNGRWVQGDLRFTVVRQGLIFRFSGAEQRRQFLADSNRFMPVKAGQDVVLASEENRAVSGETTYCAIYQGRLYMFSSAASQSKFNQNPSRYALP